MELTGKLLIAMPGMAGSGFDHSVIYICAHSDDGAMGLIINKPAEDVRMVDLVEQLEISTESETALHDTPVCIGGPVEQGRGFVLHSPEYNSRIHTLEVDGLFSMTATLDVLEDIASGEGPARSLLMLGYSGWAAGQLEDEISRNGWLIGPASPELVFGAPIEDKWGLALRSIGVDPIGLSATAGRA
ncbi:MAG: YqgE/AlgH family protein [Paracoccaceae bacterium]